MCGLPARVIFSFARGRARGTWRRLASGLATAKLQNMCEERASAYTPRRSAQESGAEPGAPRAERAPKKILRVEEG